MKVVWQGAACRSGRTRVVRPPLEARRKRVLTSVELGWPVFVKPARAGSSIGITRVEAEPIWRPRSRTREHDPKVIVEAAIEGREIECGVLEGLDDEPPEASLPAEVRVAPATRPLRLRGEVSRRGAAARHPAGPAADVTKRVRKLSVQAFEALGCEGLARVDFFYTPDRRVVLNEINTMPGFTPASVFPTMWAATGLDYPALVDRLLQLALHRPTGLR